MCKKCNNFVDMTSVNVIIPYSRSNSGVYHLGKGGYRGGRGGRHVAIL